MIYYNGQRIENEWMHPEIKPLFWQYNGADVNRAILEAGIHPCHATSGEVAALRSALETAEVAR